MAGKLILLEIKKKLHESSKEELVEWVTEAQALIDKEFNPSRGVPKLWPVTVKKIFTEVNRLGKGTIWPLEVMVFFLETASDYIHYEGDIFENMGDFFTSTYEKVIQLLNKEQTPDLFEKYQARLEAVAKKPNCHCWGIQDSLVGSYTELKWVDADEFLDEL